MKTIFSVIIVASIIFWGEDNYSVKNETGIIPEVNKKIIEFVNQNMGKKIGRGECWDLVAQALAYAGAKWDGMWKFGKVVDYKKDKIYPGDIIQFTNVKTEYTKDLVTYYGSMLKHTAIVYKVKSKNEYVIAEQNTPHSGRTVGLGNINFNHITEGKFTIYRPVK